MEARDWIALIAVLIGPLSVLAGAWMNAYLARASKRQEAEAAARRDALDALGHMKALLVDAEPGLLLSGEILEYGSPEEAVKGLLQRWLSAREPLVLLSVTHPSAEVRQVAFALQAEAEMALRQVHKAIEGQEVDVRRWWEGAASSAARLGELLSPYQTPRKSGRFSSAGVHVVSEERRQH